MVIRRGDIWWADLAVPTGSEAGYIRPVLVVQDDQMNRSGLATVVIVPLTSNLRYADADGNARLETSETGLPKTSVALTASIEAINKADLRDRVGSLSRDSMDAVDVALMTTLDLIS